MHQGVKVVLHNLHDKGAASVVEERGEMAQNVFMLQRQNTSGFVIEFGIVCLQKDFSGKPPAPTIFPFRLIHNPRRALPQATNGVELPGVWNGLRR